MTPDRVPGLVNTLVAILQTENRMEQAPWLASQLGGENLLVFSNDPVLRISLPAAGFPQTMPAGRRWLDFLQSVPAEGIGKAILPSPYSGCETAVTAVSDGAGCILAFLGKQPPAEILSAITSLLPLVGQALLGEQQMRLHSATVQEMRREIVNVRQLTKALDTVRRELELALERAGRETAVAEQATRDLLRANEQLAVVRDQALAANRAKSAFLANMSHELRTPLTAVIGYAEMLQDEITKPEARTDLKRIQDAGHHLLMLVNDILDMAKIEAGKVVATAEKFSVDEVLIEAAEVVTPQAAAHGNKILVHPNSNIPHLNTDRGKLRQILLNLLSNAAKFTQDGTITLTAEFCTENDTVMFSVSDTGIGIPPHELPEIFTEFTQVVNSAEPKIPGTGLGLSICKRMCLLLGGHIHVKSQPGKGSVFTVEIPLSLPADDNRGGAAG